MKSKTVIVSENDSLTLKMCRSYNRHTAVTGDAQDNVINTLEKHSLDHEEHDWKLWLILALVVVKLIIILWKEYKAAMRRQAIRAVNQRASTQNI